MCTASMLTMAGIRQRSTSFRLYSLFAESLFIVVLSNNLEIIERKRTRFRPVHAHQNSPKQRLLVASRRLEAMPGKAKRFKHGLGFVSRIELRQVIRASIKWNRNAANL